MHMCGNTLQHSEVNTHTLPIDFSLPEHMGVLLDHGEFEVRL